jgi:hypothetical protein
MAACRFEVHHRVPRCLLGFFDRATAGELDGAGLQAWFDWEEEAFRYGIKPDISREDLVSLIDSSAAPILAAEHRAGHSQAGDFVRWGRRVGSPPWPSTVGAGSCCWQGGAGRRSAPCSSKRRLQP